MKSSEDTEYDMNERIILEWMGWYWMRSDLKGLDYMKYSGNVRLHKSEPDDIGWNLIGFEETKWHQIPWDEIRYNPKSFE